MGLWQLVPGAQWRLCGGKLFPPQNAMRFGRKTLAKCGEQLLNDYSRISASYQSKNCRTRAELVVLTMMVCKPSGATEAACPARSVAGSSGSIMITRLR